jgi:hypothetical protein
MKREKHGQYDNEKHQPDNRMQPTGSGQGVWLNQQVLRLLGEQEGQALIDASVAHKEKRYDWLCSQMAVLGYPELTEQYHQKRKEATATSRLRDHQRTVEQIRERFEEETDMDQSRRQYLQKRLEKAQKYIDERS